MTLNDDDTLDPASHHPVWRRLGIILLLIIILWL